MRSLKRCECGARPVWRPAERRRRRGRASTVRPERLECPACGNRTAAGTSRQALAGEWNSAGRRGQAQAEPELVPFGPEWRAQCMALKKPELIDHLESALRRGRQLDGLVSGLRGELGKFERVTARLQARLNGKN